MRIVVAGKGGAGKSFLTGTLARLLARRGCKVVVLDSDPMPGVAISLGMGPIDAEMLAGAVMQGADDRWRLRPGIGPARAILEFSHVGPDGVRLLQFGKAGSSGLSPIMGSLNGFTQVVRRLATEPVLRDWTVIGDLPAGPRQTAFDWAPYARRTIVVVEPTVQSILTARRVARLARERDRGVVSVVVNKATDAADVDMVVAELGEDALGVLPMDAAVAAADTLGLAPVDHAPDSAAVVAVAELASRLLAAAEHDRSGHTGFSNRSSAGGRP